MKHLTTIAIVVAAVLVGCSDSRSYELEARDQMLASFELAVSRVAELDEEDLTSARAQIAQLKNAATSGERDDFDQAAESFEKAAAHADESIARSELKTAIIEEALAFCLPPELDEVLLLYRREVPLETEVLIAGRESRLLSAKAARLGWRHPDFNDLLDKSDTKLDEEERLLNEASKIRSERATLQTSISLERLTFPACGGSAEKPVVPNFIFAEGTTDIPVPPYASLKGHFQGGRLTVQFYSVGTTHVQEIHRFYDAVMGSLGWDESFDTGREMGFDPPESQDEGRGFLVGIEKIIGNSPVVADDCYCMLLRRYVAIDAVRELMYPFGDLRQEETTITLVFESAHE